MLHLSADETAWDAFVLREGGSFLQSWGWALFQESLGKKVFRYRIDEPATEHGEAHADTVGQFVLILEPLPFGLRYGFVPRGPVVRGAGARLAIPALRTAAADHACVFVRIEPTSLDDAALEGAGFAAAKPVHPADTSIVDLRKDEDALLAAMHPKTRYNIRVAQKHGVTVREAATENAHAFAADFDKFWRVLEQTAERDRFQTHEKSYYAAMLDVLSEKKGRNLKVKLVLAEHQGDVVAGLIAVRFGKTVTYLHGASLPSRRQVMAPYLLHWQVMSEAKAAGYEAYDFWGVAPAEAGDKHRWAGITRFKTGFGGARVSYSGAWELPNDRFWYSLYRAAKKIRQ